MSVVGVGNGQRGRGRVAVAPVDGGTGAINVESQPEHGVRLIELDVYPYTKMQIVRKVRLVR